MNILIIEDTLTEQFANDCMALVQAGHVLHTCKSVAEWRRRINRYHDGRAEQNVYNPYHFPLEEYPPIDEREIDIVMTDLFMPVDGTNLGYKLRGNEPELPYGYIIALRYLAIGKHVAIVTAGELVRKEYHLNAVKSADHHDSPLMSVNDMIMHLRSKLTYWHSKKYLQAFNNMQVAPDVFPYSFTNQKTHHEF